MSTNYAKHARTYADNLARWYGFTLVEFEKGSRTYGRQWSVHYTYKHGNDLFSSVTISGRTAEALCDAIRHFESGMMVARTISGQERTP